jgi:hypothetical protein
MYVGDMVVEHGILKRFIKGKKEDIRERMGGKRTEGYIIHET